MYPGFQDEPGPQDRDSPLGLLIAPGILMWLVPGSPAAAYLGVPRVVLKHLGQRFNARGECVKLGELCFAAIATLADRGRRRGTPLRFLGLIGQDQCGEEQILRVVRRGARQLAIDHRGKAADMLLFAISTGDGKGPAADVQRDLAHASKLSMSSSSSSIAADTRLRSCASLAEAGVRGCVTSASAASSVRLRACEIRATILSKASCSMDFG